MKIYLDVSCLNRPFDNQSQERVRMEAEAVTFILERVDAGEWEEVSSEIAEIEIDAIRDHERRARVRLLLPRPRDIIKLTEPSFQRASELTRLGLKPADALHVACAETAGADVLRSCDDPLCRTAKRRQRDLRVRVANPLDG